MSRLTSALEQGFEVVRGAYELFVEQPFVDAMRIIYSLNILLCKRGLCY